MPKTALKTKQDGTIPQHVAIIMDGNGRWAKSRGMPRKLGHKKGAEALKELLNTSGNIGVSYLTVYAFSSENWGRPQEEVSDLMGLLGRYLDHESELLIKNEIRFRTIGDLSTLSDDLREKVENLIDKTRSFSKLHLTLALSYGGQQEIVAAVRNLISEGIPAKDIDEEAIASRLYTSDLPELDLLIRTGGDQRLSNFLLWQSAYTELYFTSKYWPDFNSDDFQAAIDSFGVRERRYGNV